MTPNRGYTADRDQFRRLTDSTLSEVMDDEEQAAYLRKWAAEHPAADRSGCGATATVLLCAVVGIMTWMIGGVA